MPFVSGIDWEIEKSVNNVFRRCQIQRRALTNGQYDGTWFDITDYVIRWGNVESAIDDTRLNRFTHAGLQLTVSNDDGRFNNESDPDSFWVGYLTRYRTLVRIQAGYIQENSSELPTDTTIGIFILDNEISTNAETNETILDCKSLMSPFEEVRATEIPNLSNSVTASDVITRIRDHTDGSGNFVFRQFITSTSWTIQTTTQIFSTFDTTTSRDGLSVWEWMTKLAEAEGFILYISRTGGLNFRDRSATSLTPTINLNGLGFPRPNVIKLDSYKEALNKYFNFIRFKWSEADTTTSYVTAGTTTTVNPSNPSWIYGVKKYEFENVFVSTSTSAQTIANNLYTTHSVLKEEVNLQTKFLPHLEISDLVTLSYRSYDPGATTIWDGFDWASATASSPSDGGNWASDEKDNVDFENKKFVVLSKTHDVENFTSNIILSEVI